MNTVKFSNTTNTAPNLVFDTGLEFLGRLGIPSTIECESLGFCKLVQILYIYMTISTNVIIVRILNFQKIQPCSQILSWLYFKFQILLLLIAALTLIWRDLERIIEQYASDFSPYNNPKRRRIQTKKVGHDLSILQINFSVNKFFLAGWWVKKDLFERT
jgi:hypothetical protein